MIRFALRGLRSQWTAWLGTLAVLALAAALAYVCLVHRYTVTRPEVVAEARRLGVGPQLLELSGTTIYFYSALVTTPVVAIVGRSCVQALRPTWAQWRLAVALPRQIRTSVTATVALVGLAACLPGVLLGMLAAQPVSSVLTRMAAARMGAITIEHHVGSVLQAVASVVLIAVLGAIGPALHAARVPAVAALRDTAEARARVGLTRCVLIAAWVAVCAGQAWLFWSVEPVRTSSGLPAGGGQAMLLSLLLGILVVVAAPVLIPPALRAWTTPLARRGAVAMIARRSAAWRGEVGASAVALLALALTFSSAMLSAAQTNSAVAAAAGQVNAINQLDTYVLAAVMAAVATCGAVAIISMTSRSREREFASLRCAGTTPGNMRAQAVIEPAIYVGTALVLTLVPLTVTTLGEAWFLSKAGLPYLPAPAWWQTLSLALGAYLALVTVTIIPAVRALRVPITIALAAE